MNPVIVYFLLVKATLTSFSGMSSLPIVHHDFVVERRALTERQLATALAVGRAVPGPNGLYMVGVGYLAAGRPGATAGCLALMTPPFLVIPLLLFVGRRADNPRVRGAIRTVTLAAAGLILSAVIPLARSELASPWSAAIAGLSFCLLSFTRLDTFWVILIAAVLGAGRLLAG
jgi:chromate transporter